MPATITVKIDDDIFIVVENMKDSAGTSRSQVINRLLRQGVNYRLLKSSMEKMGAKQDRLAAFMLRYLELTDRSDIVAELSHIMEDDEDE